MLSLQSILSCFVTLWILTIFNGPQLKLIDAPSQDGCFLNYIADHLKTDIEFDCSNNDNNVISLFAYYLNIAPKLAAIASSNSVPPANITNVCINLETIAEIAATVPECPLQNYQVMNNSLRARRQDVGAPSCIPADEFKKYQEFLATYNQNPKMAQLVCELSSDKTSFSDLGEDRYIGPWRTGTKAYGGSSYKCTDTLFANDVGDYYNFLMGNVCTGALEQRCIFDRITYVILSVASIGLATIFIYADFEQDGNGKLSVIQIIIAVICIVIIVVLPMIVAVQTMRSATKSFAGQSSNTLGMSSQAGSLNIGSLGLDLGNTLISFLRLGTTPHENSYECGMEWSEAVYGLLNNLLTKTTRTAIFGTGQSGTVDIGNIDVGIVTADDTTTNPIFSSIWEILKLMKYSTELTAFFYLRLVTIPVTLIMTYFMVKTQTGTLYKSVAFNDFGETRL